MTRHIAKTGVIGHRIKDDEVVVIFSLENGDEVEVPLSQMHNQSLRLISGLCDKAMSRPPARGAGSEADGIGVSRG